MKDSKIDGIDCEDTVRMAFELLDRGIEERREEIKRIVAEIESFQEERFRLTDAIRKANRKKGRR